MLQCDKHAQLILSLNLKLFVWIVFFKSVKYIYYIATELQIILSQYQISETESTVTKEY